MDISYVTPGYQNEAKYRREKNFIIESSICLNVFGVWIFKVLAKYWQSTGCHFCKIKFGLLYRNLHFQIHYGMKIGNQNWQDILKTLIPTV
jgi:hypothetical protein